MRKIIRPLLLLLLLACLVQAGPARVEISFDADGAMAIIKELTSAAYDGRMCGTKGNERAVAYIARRFAGTRLRPLIGAKSFRQDFQSYVPRLRSTPLLQVYDRAGKLVKNYAHRIDFREITAGLARSGDLRGRFSAAATAGEINGGGRGLYLLADENYQVQEDYALRSSGLKALIVRNPDAVVRRKSLSLLGWQGGSGDSFVKIFVRPKVYEELAAGSRAGCQIRVKVDLTVDRVKTANLLGLLEGSAPPAKREVLLLCAHLDHIGRDPGGRVFPGALDNASGAAVLLTIMDALAKLPVRPAKTIVFAALNAEESTLGGSGHLAGNWPFREAPAAEVLNLDMLGAKETAALSCLVAAEAPGEGEQAMIDRLRALAGRLKIPFAVTPNPAADHTSFAGAGITAVTLNSPAEVHFVGDTSANIDRGRLAAAGALVARYVAETAF